MIRIYKPRGMEWKALMVSIVETLKPEVYVEVGTNRCKTFNLIAPLVKYAVGVDIWEGSGKCMIDLPHAEFWCGKSPDIVSEWVARGSRPIDFLFIDANHEYKHVLADFDAWTPFVVEGTGIIALHDTCPLFENYYKHCLDAWKAAYEIRTAKRYRDKFEIMTLPGWNGLSVIRKASKHLPTLPLGNNTNVSD